MKAKRTRKVPQLVDVKDAPSEALVRLRAGDAALAMALLREGGPLGPALGAELADALAKSIKRPRGRPALTERQRVQRAALGRFCRYLIELMTTTPPRYSYLDAKAKCAVFLRLTDGQLNHLLHPEGPDAYLVEAMSIYDCYVLLPWLRDLVNESHAMVTTAAAETGVTVAEFYAALERRRQGAPPTKP